MFMHAVSQSAQLWGSTGGTKNWVYVDDDDDDDDGVVNARSKLCER